MKTEDRLFEVVASFLHLCLHVFAVSGLVIREEPADTVTTQVGPDQVRTATLYCRTNSQDDSIITTWYKDNVNVEDGNLPFYNITKESLVVQTADPHDTGESLEGLYYCVINNGTVAVRSKSAYIRGDRSTFFVSPLTGAFSTQATVVVAQTGYLQLPVSDNRPFWFVECESVTISCTSTSCLFWHDVSVTGRLVVFSVLRIRYSEIRNNIDKCRNESTIRVIGTIGAPRMEGTFTFKDTRLLVPRVYIQNQHNFVKVGSNATLYCISSHISSSYTWKRDDSTVIVVGMRFSLLIDGVLHIQNVTEQDSGQYECTATATFSLFGVVTRKVSWSVTVYSLPRVTLSLSQLNDTHTKQFCNTTNLVVPCILNHLPTTVKCQAKGSFPTLIQLFHNGQLLLKQNVTNANHAVQHTISSPRSGIYQCIARNEYSSKQSSLSATVSVTSRSSTTAATSPSMQQSTDYVSTSQSTPRASSTSTSSSYSSQPTNATSHNVQSTSGTKSPRVTSAPVTVTQANASSVSLSSSSPTLNLLTTSTPRTSSSSQRSDLIPTTSTVLPTSQTASPPFHHANTLSSSGAAKPHIGKVTSAATSEDASESTTKPAIKATTPTQSSQKKSEETTMRENPAYNFISSHARGGTVPSSTDAVQYEEVGMDATKRQCSYENISMP
ncbi:hemicentin-1-like isoform X2 [Corticium candelabrum]|uniref:hemicentin-1-like isoform X2 n=1 Tax=Corticium candelabrum TaxID=121492 RepID=UPI002E25DAE6|nr:hemicentin-1-like isoform X2 [Corticium candelabrum]